MAIFTCCISSCCHFGRLRNSFTIKWYFVIEKTAKACNNSAYFFYIIGYNKINYNLQKKVSLKILLGGACPPLPPCFPRPCFMPFPSWFCLLNLSISSAISTITSGFSISFSSLDISLIFFLNLLIRFQLHTLTYF